MTKHFAYVELCTLSAISPNYSIVNTINLTNTYFSLFQTFPHLKFVRVCSSRCSVWRSSTDRDLCLSPSSPCCWDTESRDYSLVSSSCSETEALWYTWLRIMAAVAEGVKLNWNLSTEDILKRTDELIERSRKVYNAVGALKPEELAYENCLKVKTCLPTALSIQFFNFFPWRTNCPRAAISFDSLRVSFEHMNGCVLLFCKPDRTSGSFVGIFRNDVLNMGKFSCFF